MFMDRKTQHCQHVTSSQPDFWILIGTKLNLKINLGELTIVESWYQIYHEHDIAPLIISSLASVSNAMFYIV